MYRLQYGVGVVPMLKSLQGERRTRERRSFFVHNFVIASFQRT